MSKILPCLIVAFGIASFGWTGEAPPPKVPRKKAPKNMQAFSQTVIANSAGFTTPQPIGESSNPNTLISVEKTDKKRYVYELDMVWKKTLIPQPASQGGNLQFEGLAYESPSLGAKQPLVGPTLITRRNSKLHLYFTNRVSQELPPAAGTENVANSNQPHDLNTTNIHTHGLHVSPTKPADDVSLEIRPGEHFHYSYEIPANHPAGTFWYHPHKHGSVAYQIANGMAGALIVPGDPGNPADLESIPEIGNLKPEQDQVFVFQQIQYRLNTKSNTNEIFPQDIYGDAPIDVAPADWGSFAAPADGTVPESLWLINGQATPTITLAPGEVRRWRFIHAGREEAIFLVFQKRKIVAGTIAKGDPLATAPFYEIAYDGLATGHMEKVTRIELYPAYRRDVLIKAPEDKPGDGEAWVLATESLDQTQSLRGVKIDPKALAIVKIDGAPSNARLPDPTAFKTLLGKLDYSLSNADHPILRSLSLNSQDRNDPDIPHFWIGTGTDFGRDHIPLALNRNEKWHLSAKTSPDAGGGHPFHIHVNPFLHELKNSTWQDDGTPKFVWRDTLFVATSSPGENIWMSPKDLTGDSVLHCHILDHEDQGMMARIRIFKTKDEAQQSAVAQALNAPAQPKKVTDKALIPGKGRLATVVMFKGLTCSHCVGQLIGLVAHAPEVGLLNTDMLAFSSIPLPNPLPPPAIELDKSIKLASDNAGLSLFREVGAVEGERALHGLFIVDDQGTVLREYVGESPFESADAVIDALRSIRAKTKTPNPTY